MCVRYLPFPITVHLTHSGVPEYATIFDPSRPCSLLSDDRALHTGDSRPPEVDAVDLPPPVFTARREQATCAFRVAPRLQAPLIYCIAARRCLRPCIARRSAASAPTTRLPQQLGVGKDGDGADELGLH